MTYLYKLDVKNDDTICSANPCENVWRKYRDSFDSLSDIWDIQDYLTWLYEKGGETAVDNWFLPGATEEYKRDYKALIIKERG